jgi:hypothetical protein
MQREAPGVAASLLEGLDEIVTDWKPTGNCRLSDGHSPITILRIWKVRDEVRVTSKRPCERPHIPSTLPDDDFLLGATCRHAACAP